MLAARSKRAMSAAEGPRVELSSNSGSASYESSQTCQERTRAGAGPVCRLGA